MVDNVLHRSRIDWMIRLFEFGARGVLKVCEMLDLELSGRRKLSGH